MGIVAKQKSPAQRTENVASEKGLRAMTTSDCLIPCFPS
jgi:hypothetical protein